MKYTIDEREIDVMVKTIIMFTTIMLTDSLSREDVNKLLDKCTKLVSSYLTPLENDEKS